MQQNQLSFDDAFNSVFLDAANSISPGDIVSLMNKKNFDHAFHVVTESGPGYLKTYRKNSRQIPENMHEFHFLTPVVGPFDSPAYENSEYAIAKTNRKNPFAEWNRVGLLGDFNEQHIKKSHASMGIKNRNQ